ncbi:MAG: (d)CMP kinase [Clostridiales Family XIII bacterium]|jgi:cytidylate kinase|nr:(d)CMP kinase [Clostridiales Family XIII bacterium]
MHTVIAIDGPSGAGKSTVAKLLSEKLGIEYIDTGAMYRAAALYLLGAGIDIHDSEALNAALGEMSIDFSDGRTMLNGEDISALIRTPEVTAFASESSALALVREKLVALQRRMGAEKSVVLDGRDIGTNVFPHTKFKYFLTASPEVRARRRADEMEERGEDPDFDEVLAAINKRDLSDMTRELNPLVQAADAVLIVTDDMSAEDAATLIASSVGDELAANVKY